MARLSKRRKRTIILQHSRNRGKYDIACKEQQNRVATLQNELQVNGGDDTKLSLQKRLKKETAILEEMTFIVLRILYFVNFSVMGVFIWTNLSLQSGESRLLFWTIICYIFIINE